MASWAELTNKLESIPLDQRAAWIQKTSADALDRLARRTKRNVIVYASGFLQKPHVPGVLVSVAPEDINGFMTALYRMKCGKGLLLVLHTPGGSPEAAEAIVDYLRSKFSDIQVLIPTYAMSAGTMISLAADRMLMGKHSQLGPTDPQIVMNGAQYSAHSIVEQFDEAKDQIAKDPNVARAWAPVLQPFGPALLRSAQKALDYGKTLVIRWLEQNMFKGLPDAHAKAEAVANYFSGSTHGSHGRRIDRTEAKAQGLTVVDLETDPKLQADALTLYHALTIIFEKTLASKVIMSTNKNAWIKNVPGAP